MSSEASFSIDDGVQRERQSVWDEARKYFEQRALIEQAKGMLMFVYGIDADEAFDVLREQSQQHNVKLRAVAEQVVKDLIELARAKGPVRRLALDGLMSTARRRVDDVAPRLLDGQCETGVPVRHLGTRS